MLVNLDGFDEGAHKVLGRARQEAQKFGHEYVGTEHLLLGLILEGSGVAANVLREMGADVRSARIEIEQLVKPGQQMETVEPAGRLPFNLCAKEVINLAREEATRLKHEHVGTVHLLLGLLKEPEGMAAQVLVKLGLKLGEIHEKVLEPLNKPGMASSDEKVETKKPARMEVKFVQLVVVNANFIDGDGRKLESQRLFGLTKGGDVFWNPLIGDKGWSSVLMEIID